MLIIHILYMQIEYGALKLDLDVGDDNDKYLWRKLERQHDRLRQVDIAGFCASKSLVKLTTFILENAPSLERLTLDSIYNYDGSLGTTSKCPTSTRISQFLSSRKTTLVGARRAVEVASRCIAGRVPSYVQFKVLDPGN